MQSSQQLTTAATLLPVPQRTDVDTQLSIARAWPRQLATFIQRATGMATISDEVAASCLCMLPRGSKRQHGPGVRLAEIAAAAYGNLRVGATIIASDGCTITARGICHDLENNLVAQADVVRSIAPADADATEAAAGAACAIAYRNAVYRAIPVAYITAIYDKVCEVVRGSAETLAARRAWAMGYFTALGVDEAQLLARLGADSVAAIDTHKLEVLLSMRSAIANGEADIAELFAPEPTVEELIAQLYEEKKALLEPHEQEAAERIMSTEETPSYHKLHQLLQSK